MITRVQSCECLHLPYVSLDSRDTVRADSAVVCVCCSGTDSEYTSKSINFAGFRSYLKRKPLWTTLGNHDVASKSAGETGPYFARFKPPRAGEAGGVASSTAAYHSFDYGMVHFVILDSYYSSRSSTGPMITWLRADLAAIDKAKTKWLIAMFHHCVYSKGSHDSDVEVWSVEMRGAALPVLEAAGLDLLINGHSHNYERSYLINGHYGKSSTLTSANIIQNSLGGGVLGGAAYTKPAGLTANNGEVVVTTGASQSVDLVTDGMMHPAMVRFPATNLNGLISDMGTLMIDVSLTQLNATYVLNNATAADSFTILKS